MCQRPTCRGFSSVSTGPTRPARAASAIPGGTGLGLAIVKHLIELHGGTVAAANRQAAGRCSRSSCRVMARARDRCSAARVRSVRAVS